jgi:hypothetical protein
VSLVVKALTAIVPAVVVSSMSPAPAVVLFTMELCSIADNPVTMLPLVALAASNVP